MSSAPVPPLPGKTDIFGVCTAIGRDFGFPSDILRVAFAIGLFVDAKVAIGFYVVLGAIVLVSGWLFPVRAIAATPVAAAPENVPAAIEPAEPEWRRAA